MVNDATLLESFEGLGDPPQVSMSGEIWQRLQDEKIEVSESLLDEGLLHGQAFGPDYDVTDEAANELECRHRERLENRLRQLTKAQDRLFEGNYGRCTDCGEQIATRRLAADPATGLCYSCQAATDRNQKFYSL